MSAFFFNVKIPDIVVLVPIIYLYKRYEHDESFFVVPRTIDSRNNNQLFIEIVLALVYVFTIASFAFCT